MALTDVMLKRMAKAPRPGKYAAGNGLFLRIDKGLRLYWRARWRIEGRETEQSYGRYPEVTLAKAREAHLAARELRRQGINPIEAKRQKAAEARRAAGTPFEKVAREWFELRRPEWVASTATKTWRRLEADVLPYIGKRPIETLKGADILTVVLQIAKRGAAETAHRAMENISCICQHAVICGLIPSDPARDLKKALPRPVEKHFAALTSPQEFGGLLRAIDGYKGTPIVRAALALAPMLFLRPNELRYARWKEIDLEGAVWTIPAARMKRTVEGKRNGDPHIVPLSQQAVALLRDLQPLTGANTEGLVFPGERDHSRAMSENTVNAALRRMGYDTQHDMTGHGFRASARTLLDERLDFSPDVIEAQLAHRVRDSLGRAYNRTQYLEQRTRMMQAWSDYLDTLKAGLTPTTAQPVDMARREAANAPRSEERSAA